MKSVDNRPLRVFLCHSSNDKPAVRELYQKLRAEPWIQPWLDEEELFPGMDWNMEIEKAIEETDVIIVCLSNGSITKEGYVQKEIRAALDYADYKPEGTLFIIPVRLEECTPPKRLGRWQYADYFEGQRERGIKRLLASLRMRADSLRLNLEAVASDKDVQVFENIFDQAVKILQDEGLVSYPRLQKRLKITYTNAVRIINMMEEKNIVSSTDGALFYRIMDSNVKPENLPIEPISLSRPNNTQFQQTPLHTGDKLILSNGMEFMRVPAGGFLMGSNDDNEFASDNEKPQKILDISYDYWMARFPVTNEQYYFFTEAHRRDHPIFGWEHKRNHPVVYINWDDANEYVDWLNNLLKKELPLGLMLRLPTEKEWEKASRGVDGREYPWGNKFDSNNCNSSETKKNDTTPVMYYSPSGDSPYGCSDMVGNVWEWTYTEYQKYSLMINIEEKKATSLGVVRGGSFINTINFLRCAARDPIATKLSNDIIGFRVTLSSPLPR
jgi:formylglycine-generating enzyme required for sulfatase activity